MTTTGTTTGTTAKGRRVIHCRGCSEWGYEDPDDPCPGLCPDCMEAALLEATFALWDDRWERGLTVRGCLDANDQRLRLIGMTEAAVARWRRWAERELADELAAERRGN